MNSSSSTPPVQSTRGISRLSLAFALGIAFVMAVSFVVTPSQQWRLEPGYLIALFMIISNLAAAWLSRIGQRRLAVLVLVSSIGVGSLIISSFLVQGLGLICGLFVFVSSSAVGGYALPRQYSVRVVLTSALVGCVIILLDIFGIPRPPLDPSVALTINLTLGVLMVIPGILVVRSFASYSLSAKFITTFILIGLISVAVCYLVFENISTETRHRDALVVAMAVGALSAVAAVTLSRLLLRPITELTQAAVKVKAGDLTANVHVTSKDELAVLTDVFNDMTAQLNAILSDLENRVQQRTAEFEQANQQLGVEVGLSKDKHKSSSPASPSASLQRVKKRQVAESKDRK